MIAGGINYPVPRPWQESIRKPEKSKIYQPNIQQQVNSKSVKMTLGTIAFYSYRWENNLSERL
jgi:hypothetical protein